MPTRHYDWIAHHSARRPEAPATVELETGRRLTYRTFDLRIAALARHLHEACGVSSGVRVALLAHSSTDTFELQFACFRLGANFVPLNWRLAAPELDAIIADCTPTVLVHDGEFTVIAKELTVRNGLAHLLAFGSQHGADEDAESLPAAAAARSTHDDACTILYTSGTTGSAKGHHQRHELLERGELRRRRCTLRADCVPLDPPAPSTPRG